MKRLWEVWVKLLSRREGAEPLAACRIMAGIGVMASILLVLPSGIIDVVWTSDGYRDLGNGPWLVALLGGPNPVTVWALAILAFAAGCGLAIGCFTRTCAFLALLVFSNLIRINFHDGSAYDSVLTNQLLILVFAQSGATWSIDCRRRTGNWVSLGAVPSWPRYVMILQLVLVYFSTGLQKISAHWIPGGDHSALYYILQDPFWRRFDVMEIAAQWYPLTQVGTAITWWWEVLAPLLLLAFYFRATRNRKGWLRALFNRIDFRLWYALLGVVFHLGIHALMRVGPFSWITLSYYPALWSAREWRSRRPPRQAETASD